MAVPEISKARVVHGYDEATDRAQPITLTEDGTKNRLDVSAAVTGVASVNLDHTDDEVTTANTSDGGTTRALTKGDTDGTTQVNVTKVGSNAISVDGGRQNTNATLQVADADASVSNPVPARITDGTDSALVTSSGELNVIATAQPGTDIGDVTVNNAAGASAVNVQDGGNSLTVDQPTASNLNAQVVGAAADGAAVAGNPVRIGGKDGSGNTQDMRTDTTGNMLVSHKSVSAADGDNLSQTQSVPLAEDGSLLTHVVMNRVFDPAGNWDRQRGNTNGTLVQGAAAHDAAVAGNPVWTGLEAIAHGANPSEVASGDVTTWWANRAGIAFVLNGHPNMKRAEYHWTTAQTDDDVLGAISAGTIYVVTGYSVTSDADTTVAVKFRIGFGATTVPAEPADGASVTGMIAAHSGVIPGGGIVESGLYLPGGDGQEVRITCEAPTTGSCKLLITYFTIAS